MSLAHSGVYVCCTLMCVGILHHALARMGAPGACPSLSVHDGEGVMTYDYRYSGIL